MPNSLHNRTARIGGGLASSIGGYLDVTPRDGETRSLDVGRWTLRELFEETPLECSGNLGATDSRRTGYRYLFALDLLFDLREPLDYLLRDLPSGPEIIFWFGDSDRSGLVDAAGMPIDGGETIEERYYWMPEAHLDECVPLLDAQGKKLMGMHVAGHAVSHVFLIPEQGDPDDEETLAGAYGRWYFAE